MWSVGVIVYLFVVGYPPFNAEPETELFKRIRNASFTFPKQHAPSEAAQDLIRKLLVKDPAQRLTAAQALQHPWITDIKVASDRVLNVVQSLGAFRARCRLQKAVGSVMANRMSDADRKRMDDVFNLFDENKDGQLGRDEITKMMKHLGKQESDIKAFLQGIDVNGDGTISRQELAIALSTARLGSSDTELKSAFDLFDADGDGFVDCTEIKRQCSFLSDDEVAKLIKDVDVNGDGKITLAEWVAAMKDIQTKARPTPAEASPTPATAAVASPASSTATGSSPAVAVAGADASK